MVLAEALLACVVIAGCGDEGPDPVVYEALPENQATAQAGIDFGTTGSLHISANCPTINCPNGTPGATILVPISRATITVTPTGPRSFSFTAQVGGATTSDIPVNITNVQCGLDVDTSAGSSPTVTFTGTATFVTPPSGSPNRLDVTIAASGIEDADLTLTGGTACAALNSSISFVVGALEDYLGGTLHFCGAPGPTLLVECPVTGALRSL